MNILIVHNFYKTSGGEDTVVFNEIEILRKNGHKVFTYFKYNDNIDISGFNKIGLFKRTIFNRSIKKELTEIIKSNQIEVVHCHNTFPLISFSVYQYAKKAGCKVVQTIHNFRFLCANGEFVKDGEVCEDCLTVGLRCALKNKCYHKSFFQTFAWVEMQKRFRKKRGYKYVDKFICLTEFNKEKLSFIIPREKICVKANGSKFEPEYSKEKRNQFLFVGRLEKIKGCELLISAFSRNGMPKLKICGEGKEREQLERLASRCENIEFAGKLDSEKLKKELERSYAVIVPSKWYEGFPMIIAESFSLGVPVIANDMGNLPYIVQDKVNGMIYDRNSVDSMAEIVLNLYHDPELQKQLQENAFDTFKSQLSNEKNYQNLMRIYQE